MLSDKLNNIAGKYHSILENTEPFVLTYPGNLEYFNLNPWGLEIKHERRFSCLSAKNEQFFDLLHKLDGLSFGTVGMPMDKWVFFDCGEMPGGIFGFGLPASKLSDKALKAYQLTEKDDTFVPIAMYIAIPCAREGYWFGHNLCTTNRVLDHQFPGLALLTKAVAIKVYRITNMLGATQWDSAALNIHLQLADMDMESAYTPAHSIKNTMAYASCYTDEGVINALSGETRVANSWDFVYPSDDVEFSKKMQEKIEGGARFRLNGRPFKKDEKVVYPVKQL
ncbi:MAG: hypothetical protein GY781_12085 [Gammaproteobacteria bacterium]|nr:hypothetical protein [Gammaproteobacteria bacterium]